MLGSLNSLSQLALKTLLPGVPDFFQGTELYDFSLVDPDNRRPVDYAMRAAMMTDTLSWQDLAAQWQDGRIKFALTHRLLQIRNANAELFRDGRYEPLSIEGEHGDHVIGFVRAFGKRRIVVAIGRHFAGLTDGGRTWPHGWRGAIRLPFSRGHDLIGDRTVGRDCRTRHAVP